MYTWTQSITIRDLIEESESDNPRRMWGDLIEVYRIMNGIEAVDWKFLLSKTPYDGTGGHTKKLENNIMRLDVHKYIFSQRVIDYRNALPQTDIDEICINKFKSQLKIHLNNIIMGLHEPLTSSLVPTLHLNWRVGYGKYGKKYVSQIAQTGYDASS